MGVRYSFWESPKKVGLVAMPLKQPRRVRHMVGLVILVLEVYICGKDKELRGCNRNSTVSSGYPRPVAVGLREIKSSITRTVLHLLH